MASAFLSSSSSKASFLQLPDGTWSAAFGADILRSAFQPIFALRNDRLTPIGCESLVRVYRNNTQVVNSAFFAALDVEELQIVEPLLRELHIRNAPSLPAEMRNLFLNFDPAALVSPSTFDAALSALGHQLSTVDLEPSRIVCEITENEARSAHELKYFVYALRARGYKVAIDDFGVGASQLDRVTNLTPDVVKIDGRTSQRMMDTPEGFAALKLMIGQFRDAGIQTVIEGLEQLWQIELAEAAGADMFQGFALATPQLAPANFGSWLETGLGVQTDDEPMRKQYKK